MPRRKQTARKTTGKHLALSSTSKSLKRTRPISPLSVTLNAESPKKPVPTSPDTAVAPAKTSHEDVVAFILSIAPTPIKQRPSALNESISLCTRFATWLETQKIVQDDTLLQAVDREGRPLLALAKATVMFDHALRGNVPPPVNGVANPLSEHAQTLRVFAELLKTKTAEETLSKELETAVLRDGEALARLAQSCLDFDQAIRGSVSAT